MLDQGRGRGEPTTRIAGPPAPLPRWPKRWPMETYQALAQCIDNGQVEPPFVPEILQNNPDFARWYRERGATP